MHVTVEKNTKKQQSYKQRKTTCLPSGAGEGGETEDCDVPHRGRAGHRPRVRHLHFRSVQ